MSDTAIPEPVAKRVSFSDLRARLVAGLLASLRANKRAWIFAASLVGLVLLTGTVTVNISSQPTFCAGCHEIRPAYDQWHSSSHYGVSCLSCHTDPGLAGVIKVNVAGAKNLLTHMSSDYHIPERAQVHDASCLSCHPRELRPEASVRTTLRVAHSKHDKEQCADCHGRLVHANPAVEVSTAPKPHAVRDCTVCHTPTTCPHGEATLACTSCHSGDIPKHDPARDRGVMPRESCQECHKKNKVGSPEYCQTCHVSPHGVSVQCSRCHTSNVSWTEHSFNHPVPLVGKHAGVDCDKCHGTKSLTGLKFICSDCHKPPAVHASQNGSCAQCHSPEGFRPAKMSSHKFPQEHKGAAGSCALCHPQGNTGEVNCYTCHTKANMDTKHSPKGISSTAIACAKCHPEGKKP
jgi:nitrate/TMAO reductase-like tetraheme cytochrome c subunit